MRIFKPGLRAVILLAAACGGLPAANGADSDFERGYAQALLDANYAEFGLEARPTDRAGRVEIAGEHCLSGAQQRAVADRLTGAGPIVSVQWQTGCANDAAPQTSASDRLVWLPTADLFTPLHADPREPELALGLQNYATRGDHFVVGEVSAGETFSLVEGKLGAGTWQVGIQGGAFSIFDQSRKSNDLLNTDYLIGLPVTWRQGNWSTRLRYYHVSSHLGDEFILNRDKRERLDLSFEALDGIVSHEWDQLRLYGGGGVIVRTTADLDRSMLQGGAEYRINNVIGELDLSLGADYKALDAQDFTLNQAYQAALIFTRNQRQIRFLIEYYNGKSFNGQFIFNRLEYVGAGLQFGI